MDNVTNFITTKEILPSTVGEDIIDWGLEIIHAPAAWNLSRGEGIKVAILDTGIDTNHVDLRQNIRGVANFTSSPHGVRDMQGHGTHVAGIIAGVDNDQGIIGVAPDAEIYAAKVLGDNGGGDISSIVKGIRWAIAQGVDVINMSLGTGVEPPAELHRAIQEASAAGIIIVAATGNENAPVCWPAKYPESIAVSAIDQDMHRADFSNYGVENEIIAPGVDILSTYKDGGYARLSGTSMATPIISGAVALYISYFKKYHDRKPTVAEVFEAISKSTIDLGAVGKDDEYGLGLINLDKLF